MSTRLLQRLGRGGASIFRPRVPSRRVPFRAGAIRRQAPFHHLPVMHQDAPLVAAVQEEWWDEETDFHLHSIGIHAEQVHKWLAVAAECGHADMVDDMLRWNTDWDRDCALSCAAYNWHYETIKTLTRGHSYSQKARQNALSHACDVDREDDFEIECCDKSTEARHLELAQVICWLVDARAEPDNAESASNGWPIVAVLHMYPEYAEALKALLEKGATNVRYEMRGDQRVLVRVE